MTNVVDITAPKTKQEKLDAFCEGLVNGLSRQAAYIAAGYAEHMSKPNANKYYRDNALYIQHFLAEHIGVHAPTALKVVLQIANDPNEKGGIRLKAAQDILDRAGFSAKQKVELTVSDPKEMSTEDLQNEIRKLVSEDTSLAKVFNFSESVVQ